MQTAPPYLNPSDDLSATYMRELVRYIRSITPIQGPNILLSRGPNGTIITGTPGGKKSVSSVPPAPWHIAPDSRKGQPDPKTGEDTEVAIHICTDCYYLTGQVMRKYTPDKETEAIEDFVCQGEIPEGSSQEYTDADRPFLCFRYKNAFAPGSYSEERLVGYKTEEEMMTDMRDRTLTVIPLYILTHGGGAKLDLRHTPKSQEFTIA